MVLLGFEAKDGRFVLGGGDLQNALDYADTVVELVFELALSAPRYALKCAEFSYFRESTNFRTFGGISRD